MKKVRHSLWFLVGFLPLLLVFWLAWVLPGWGFFRLEADPFYLPEDGMVLGTTNSPKPCASKYCLHSR